MIINLYVIKRPKKLWVIDNNESSLTYHTVRIENIPDKNSIGRLNTGTST